MTVQKLQQFYEGKAKKLFKTDNPDQVICYFKDDATAFNNQKKGTISNKGVLNNRKKNLKLGLAQKTSILPQV